ncbi:MAG: signal peptide peptidase SppA, partial [Bacillota bacterium]
MIDLALKMVVGLVLLFVIAIIVGTVGVVTVAAVKLLQRKLQTEPKIAVLNIDGVIESSKQKSLLNRRTSAEEIIDQLEKIEEDEAVEALMLKINSPGGSAAASDMIYQALKKFKAESMKPVIACLEDVAASGGYYVAMAADEVVANHSTITGSIGVIMQFTNLEGLFDKAGIDLETVKSGEFKDLGNASREMTDRERQLLDKMIDDVYQPFVDVVAKGRDLPREIVEQLADG